MRSRSPTPSPTQTTTCIYINGHRTEDAYVLKRPNASSCEDPANPCRAKFTYDARDRLIKHDNGHGGITTYTFDQPAMLLGDKTIRASNLTTEESPDGTVTRTYEGNRLTSLTLGAATANYFYDDFGNIDCITKELGSQADCSPSDNATSSSSTLVADYSYDSLNRLSSYRFYAGGPKKDSTDYSYDALDRTVKETETHNEWSGQTRTTKFSYQGLSDLVTEERISGRNPTTKTYSYDAFGHRISLTNDPDDPTKETKTYTYGYDVHGSGSQLITQGGQVQASYGYSAYGGEDEELTKGDNAATTLEPLNSYRYSAARMDTGMDRGQEEGGDRFGLDFGARRYGPDTTRFIQQDLYYSALGDLSLTLDPLTQNRYSLAGGNPVSYVEVDRITSRSTPPSIPLIVA